MREWISPIEAVALALCLLMVSAVTLPGLLVAREAERKVSCEDRLRQLGAGFLKYEAVHRGFPPRRSGFNDGNPYGGWGSHVFPHLGLDSQGEYDPGYDFFDPKNQKIVETQWPVFVCPSSPPDRIVQIQSQASTKALNPDKDTVFTSKATATDFIASNGVQLSRNGYGINAIDGVGNQRQPMIDNENLPLAKITDGLSNTLLLIEQAGRPSMWRNGVQKPGDGQFGMSPNARGAWAGWGSVAFGAVNAETAERPTRGDSTDCSVNCNNWVGIYGFHADGASVLFCDGSVRFVGKKLDPITFAYLTICDDGHMIEHDDF